MSLKTWFQAHRNDEREDTIVARAAMWGFTTMSFTCVALSIALMVAGRVNDAMVIVFVVSLGQIVYVSSILRLKAVR